MEPRNDVNPSGPGLSDFQRARAWRRASGNRPVCALCAHLRRGFWLPRYAAVQDYTPGTPARQADHNLLNRHLGQSPWGVHAGARRGGGMLDFDVPFWRTADRFFKTGRSSSPWRRRCVQSPRTPEEEAVGPRNDVNPSGPGLSDFQRAITCT